MQITVTISDDLAAQIQAGGSTPERYVESLIAEHAHPARQSADTAARLADLEDFFKEMAAHSAEVPLLPDEAFTRESIYEDR